jgi:hypothetical protein
MNPTYISKSLDGMMAKANDCFPIGPKASSKKQWLEDKELYLGDISGIERILTPVIIDIDIHKNVYLMDAVTGTLYKPKGGKCLTSDKLHLKRFAKPDNLADRLMNVRGEQVGGEE